MTKEPIRLGAGHYHLFHLFAPIIAESKGWFKEEGLDPVESFFTGDDDKTIDGLHKGEVDFALEPKTANVLRARARGDDICVIGGWLNRFFFAMIASKEIKRIEDLKGKKLGIRVMYTDIVWLPAREILRLHGLDPDKDIEYVSAGAATVGNCKEPLLRGDYQARLMQWPDAKQLESEGFNLLYDYTKDKQWEYQVRVIATTEKILKEHPGWTTGFLKAMIRAFRLMKTDHQQAVRTVRKSRREWQAGDHPLSFEEKPFGLYSVIPMDGSPSVEGVIRVAEMEKAAGKLPVEFDTNRILRLEYVEQAADEVNRRFGPEGFE